jgi:hypothetical protein
MIDHRGEFDDDRDDGLDDDPRRACARPTANARPSPGGLHEALGEGRLDHGPTPVANPTPHQRPT